MGLVAHQSIALRSARLASTTPRPPQRRGRGGGDDEVREGGQGWLGGEVPVHAVLHQQVVPGVAEGGTESVVKEEEVGAGHTHVSFADSREQ